MQVTITFDMNNAAFDEPDTANEVRQVLQQAFLTIVQTRLEEAPLRDSNGNSVGKVAVKCVADDWSAYE